MSASCPFKAENSALRGEFVASSSLFSAAILCTYLSTVKVPNGDGVVDLLNSDCCDVFWSFAMKMTSRGVVQNITKVTEH